MRYKRCCNINCELFSPHYFNIENIQKRSMYQLIFYLIVIFQHYDTAVVSNFQTGFETTAWKLQAYPYMLENIKRNKSVVYWCVYRWFLVFSHPLEFIFILFFSFFFWSRIWFVNNVCYCTKFDFPFNSSSKDFMFVSEDK